MKSKSDFVKTAIIVTVMALLLPVPAAYSADWQTSVNGYPIQCTVSHIDTHVNGIWFAFNLKYTFCNGNYWESFCVALPNTDNFLCSLLNGPGIQACNGATYKWPGYTSKELSLKARTANAQNYVCGELFKLMNVTVTPLE